MRAWISVALLTVGTIATPASAQTQGTEIGAGGSFLLSLQPIDDFYVGDPYLSEGIGGLGPGMQLAVTVVTPQGVVIAAEFSTAWFELQQRGRLVGGAGVTRLQDPLLGGLVGVARGRGDTQVHLLGGVSWVMKGPTINGEEISRQNDWPIALTGGFDVIHAVTRRASFAAGVRYSYLPRDLSSLGIGDHIFRFGAGLRFRLN